MRPSISWRMEKVQSLRLQKRTKKKQERTLMCVSALGFEIRVYYPFELFPQADDCLRELIGESDFAGTNFCLRDHGFIKETLQEALEIKNKIIAHFPEWTVRI